MSIQDEKIKRCISVARLFQKNIEISLDSQARFCIGIPHAWKKEHFESNVHTSFCGRGFTLDEAARDFLRVCVGWIVVEDGINPPKAMALVSP